MKKSKVSIAIQLLFLLIWLLGVYLSHWYVTVLLIAVALFTIIVWVVGKYLAYKSRKNAKKQE